MKQSPTLSHIFTLKGVVVFVLLGLFWGGGGVGEGGNPIPRRKGCKQSDGEQEQDTPLGATGWLPDVVDDCAMA